MILDHLSGSCPLGEVKQLRDVVGIERSIKVEGFQSKVRYWITYVVQQGVILDHLGYDGTVARGRIRSVTINYNLSTEFLVYPKQEPHRTEHSRKI